MTQTVEVDEMSTKEIVTQYIDAGFSVVRLHPRSKAAIEDAWPVLQPGAKQFKDNEGVGLNHHLSGTCSIDIDDKKNGLALLRALDIDIDSWFKNPAYVQIISHRPNRAKFIFKVPAGVELRKVVLRYEGAPVIELRGGQGNQDVLPPSIHPNIGQPYEWKGDWRDLPELPEEMLALWMAEKAKRTKRHRMAASSMDDPDEVPWIISPRQRAEAYAALWAIPANGMVKFDSSEGMPLKWDDDQWLKLGFAFCDATGASDEAFGVFDKWCQQSPEYQEDDLWNRWRSWHRPGAVRAATLYKWAYNNNPDWKRDFLAEYGNNDYYDKEDGGTNEYTDNAAKGWTVAFPGPMTYLKDAITAASPIPRPEYATFAAMVAMGACIDGRYNLDGLRMNQHSIVLMQSAEGKDIGIRAVERTAHQAGTKTFGSAASGSAAEEALQSGRSLIFTIDEAAHQKANAKFNSHINDYEAVALKAYSSSQGVYHTRIHAGKNDSRAVWFCCMSIFSASTATMYAKAIDTDEEAHGGNLGRMNFYYDMRVLPQVGSHRPFRIPPEVASILDRIREAKGMGETIPGTSARVIDIKVTIAARERLEEFLAISNAAKAEYNKNGNHTARVISGRRVEQTKKIAGTLAVFEDPDNPRLMVKHLDWAWMATGWTNDALLSYIENEASKTQDNLLEDKVIEFCRRILAGDVVPQKGYPGQAIAMAQKYIPRQLVSYAGPNATRSKKKLEEILANLLQAGRITPLEDITTGTNKFGKVTTTTVFKLTGN